MLLVAGTGHHGPLPLPPVPPCFFLSFLQAGLDARMRAKDSKAVRCEEHGHDHNICCGGNKGEVAGGE